MFFFVAQPPISDSRNFNAKHAVPKTKSQFAFDNWGPNELPQKERLVSQPTILQGRAVKFEGLCSTWIEGFLYVSTSLYLTQFEYLKK